MASNILPKSLILYFLPFFKMYYPKLYDKETSLSKNLKAFFLLFLLTLSSLTIINFINYLLPNLFKINNINIDLLINCSLMMILIIILTFLFINNLAKRNYMILSFFFITEILIYYFLIIKNNLNFNFDMKFLIFYLISFLNLGSLNLLRILFKA